jgi:enamine deaminase RidA (YjgF/YER057c/UK114 family)
MAITRRELEPILANVVEANGLIYVAGALADDTSQDIAGQSRQAFADVDRYLAMCGSDKSKLVSATIYVADIRLRDAMNVAWLEWIDPKNLPARACIEMQMADPRCLVEIQFVASK